MKKLSALTMFTLLATVGYYIGNAVAQNKNAQDAQTNGDGILVVEEEYDVVVPTTDKTPADARTSVSPAAVPAAAATSAAARKADVRNNNMSGNSGNDTVVEETVTEEGYVEE